MKDVWQRLPRSNRKGYDRKVWHMVHGKRCYWYVSPMAYINELGTVRSLWRRRHSVMRYY